VLENWSHNGASWRIPTYAFPNCLENNCVFVFNLIFGNIIVEHLKQLKHFLLVGLLKFQQVNPLKLETREAKVQSEETRFSKRFFWNLAEINKYFSFLNSTSRFLELDVCRCVMQGKNNFAKWCSWIYHCLQQTGKIWTKDIFEAVKKFTAQVT
jgi:hypothetical protein